MPRHLTSVVLALTVLAAGGCKPAMCGSSKDLRHKAKVLVEHYPGDTKSAELDAALAELQSAIHPEQDSKEPGLWRELVKEAGELRERIVEMDNPNLEPAKRKNLPAIFQQQHDNFLTSLKAAQDRCGE